MEIDPEELPGCNEACSFRADRSRTSDSRIVGDSRRSINCRTINICKTARVTIRSLEEICVRISPRDRTGLSSHTIVRDRVALDQGLPALGDNRSRSKKPRFELSLERRRIPS